MNKLISPITSQLPNRVKQGFVHAPNALGQHLHFLRQAEAQTKKCNEYAPSPCALA